jgi:hypothetical protein
MNIVREDIVRKLMTAANSGMKEVAQGTSAEEVFAAYLTMTRNAVLLAKDTRSDNSDIRNALMSMLILLDTPGKVN